MQAPLLGRQLREQRPCQQQLLPNRCKSCTCAGLLAGVRERARRQRRQCAFSIAARNDSGEQLSLGRRGAVTGAVTAAVQAALAPSSQAAVTAFSVFSAPPPAPPLLPLDVNFGILVRLVHGIYHRAWTVNFPQTC